MILLVLVKYISAYKKLNDLFKCIRIFVQIFSLFPNKLVFF